MRFYIRALNMQSGLEELDSGLYADSSSAALATARGLKLRFHEPAYEVRVLISGQYTDSEWSDCNNLFQEHGLIFDRSQA